MNNSEDILEIVGIESLPPNMTVDFPRSGFQKRVDITVGLAGEEKLILGESHIMMIAQSRFSDEKFRLPLRIIGEYPACPDSFNDTESIESETECEKN